MISAGLASSTAQQSGCTTEQRDRLVRRYLAVLDRPDWCDTVRAGMGQRSDDFGAWFASVALRLGLQVSPTRPVGDSG
ncbi:hypothetical protein Ga0074812_11799 [Parafrankia irregularis]|uniref:Uncharacterized protein n=1 Tax=Parafrankia irregularis TaxID=795642 RepID=A0A0S4QSX3_9ACTN|nr:MULTISPECIES: hypothetical protein [Parafrankia]MBE3205864.1 hypothetical protein [Parafrankia sp. CH37]CUU58190.1 hypothetical protein Ga0074812_11799 [Parafrankia irregularis]